MQIISHRGYWKNPEEKNSTVAFERSFKKGFGTETDLRDVLQKIVIAHDMPDASALPLFNFLELFIQYDKALPLALNIKADGLQHEVKTLIETFEIENYFFFDMSIPDALLYAEHKLRFFSRQSEYEREPAFYEQCAGIWLDAFKNQWYDADVINKHLDQGKQLAIVSSELHKRNHQELWTFLKSNSFDNSGDIILCTDIPEEATTFFYG